MVTRNNLALSKLAIKSAMAQDVPTDVMVADNQSTDGTVQWVASKPVARVSFQKQVSLAACWNAALRAAWGAGYKAAILANNDIELRPDTFRLLNAVGGEFVSCVSVGSIEQLGTPGDRTVEDLRKSQRPRPDFSAFRICKSVTDRGLWFDESLYPAFYEDNFFHLAMHRAGVRAVCVDLPFFHHSSSTLKNADPRESVVIRRGAIANRDKFRAMYGCIPSECEKYDALFSEATFGTNAAALR